MEKARRWFNQIIYHSDKSPQDQHKELLANIELTAKRVGDYVEGVIRVFDSAIIRAYQLPVPKGSQLWEVAEDLIQHGNLQSSTALEFSPTTNTLTFTLKKDLEGAFIYEVNAGFIHIKMRSRTAEGYLVEEFYLSPWQNNWSRGIMYESKERKGRLIEEEKIHLFQQDLDNHPYDRQQDSVLVPFVSHIQVGELQMDVKYPFLDPNGFVSVEDPSNLRCQDGDDYKRISSPVSLLTSDQYGIPYQLDPKEEFYTIQGRENAITFPKEFDLLKRVQSMFESISGVQNSVGLQERNE